MFTIGRCAVSAIGKQGCFFVCPETPIPYGLPVLDATDCCEASRRGELGTSGAVSIKKPPEYDCSVAVEEAPQSFCCSSDLGG
jgi:hypothetical protein